MMEVSSEKMMAIMGDVRKIKYPDLVPLYISARYMVESNIPPEEVVRYIEEHWLEREVC